MVHPDRDKIIIAVDRDRHWIYFTIGEDTDNGSILTAWLSLENGSVERHTMAT